MAAQLSNTAPARAAPQHAHRRMTGIAANIETGEAITRNIDARLTASETEMSRKIGSSAAMSTAMAVMTGGKYLRRLCRRCV